ncbi:O-antigen ligase domain-containing protein [Parabacteroides merdae]|jgi:O-antigen ligase|uniref:O-antigen ligase domain-containing protein n=2 Tax=Parabacteroides merdae TaxID=46503 RepID=A0A3R6GMJ4_9BACT|nr:O-antigen ligase domain-containing protein [Parabacteroides merdae]
MINRMLYQLKASLTINKIVIFLFLIIYCGCYYQQYLLFISFSYLLLVCTFIYNLVMHKKIIYVRFVLTSIVFLLYSVFSALWANKFDLSYNASIQLAKSSLFAMLFITLIDSKENFRWALFSFSLAGVVYSMLYVQNVDIASLGADRITTNENSDSILPNVNTVGLFLSLSFVYFFYSYFYRKKSYFLLIAAVSFIIIFLLGARKSIVSLAICILMMLYKLNSSARIKIILLSLLFISLLFVYIPTEYLSFVSERLAQLNFFSNQINELDESDANRILLLKSGFFYGMDSPILGNGYYSFSQLLLKEYGFATYSHNNFIEIFVGGGIIGFTLYYSLYYIVLKDTCKKVLRFDENYLLIILTTILLFNQLTIVVVNERFIWILLAILYSGVRCYSKVNCCENRFSCR